MTTAHPNDDKRILTLVFFDLVGSVAIAQSLSLDAYDDLLQAFQARVAHHVQAFDGMVVERFGDGTLACFGLRVDADYAAACAVSAALSVCADVNASLGIDCRVGAHCGPVMCRIVEGAAVPPSMTGLDVSVAARLQSESSAGQVTISDDLLKFTKRAAMLKVENTREVTLKGMSASMTVHRVKAVSPLRWGSASPSMVLERDPFISTILEGAKRAFYIHGPAGIGKSSLLEGVLRATPDYKPLLIRARSNFARTPFFPIAEAITIALEPHGLLDLDQNTPLVQTLERLGVDLDEDEFHALEQVLRLGDAVDTVQTFDAVKSRLLRQAVCVKVLAYLLCSEPRLLVFDDLDFADSDSLAVLCALLDQGVPETSRVIATARSGGQSQGLQTIAEQMQVLTLGGLSDGAANKLIDTIAPSMKDAVRRRILKKAQGNPLFLKALVRSAVLQVHSGRALALPSSLNATLQARIKNLEPYKDIICAASIFGRRFRFADLRLVLPDEALLEKAKTHLLSDGFLQQTGAELQFEHALLHDAAYEMLPRSKRRALHKSYVERVGDQVRATFPEIIADHAIASEEAALIVPACLKAGAHLIRQAEFGPAGYYLEAAETTLDKSDAKSQELDVLRLSTLRLSANVAVQTKGFAHPDVEESYHKLHKAVGSGSACGLEKMHALYGLFAHRMVSGRVKACRPLLQEMEVIAAQGSAEQKILSLVNEAAYGLYAGVNTQCLEACDRMHRLYDINEHGSMFLDVGADPLISVLSAQVHLNCMQSNIEEALGHLNCARAHVELIGAPLQKPWIEIFGAQALFHANLHQDARDMAEQGIAIADQQGTAFWSFTGRMWLAMFALEADPSDTNANVLKTSSDQLDAIGVGLSRPLVFSQLGRAARRRGDRDLALNWSRRAIHEVVTKGERMWAVQIFGEHSQIAAEAGLGTIARRSSGIVQALEKRRRDLL